VSKENESTFKRRLVQTIRPHLVVTIQPSSPEVQTLRPNPAQTVTPSITRNLDRPKRAAWDDRGWTRQTEDRRTIYMGFYQVEDRKRGERRRFAGRIEQTRWQLIPYIASPPAEVQKHPKWACFTPSNNPWYRIHWFRSPKNIEDCILYIERILDESINGRKKN